MSAPPILMLEIVPSTTVKNTDGSGDIVTKYSVEILAQNTTGQPINNNDTNNYTKFRSIQELEKYKSEHEKNIQIIDSNCRDEKNSINDYSLLVNKDKPLNAKETMQIAPLIARNKLIDALRPNSQGRLSQLLDIRNSTTTKGGKRKTNKKRSSYKKSTRRK